jgi:hypothetical protein
MNEDRKRILANAEFVLNQIAERSRGRSLSPDERRLTEAYEKLIERRKEKRNADR